MDKQHITFMERALDLARQGAGLTRPNPPVGAVLVDRGEIVSEGYHQKAGEPHAEVNCLRGAPDHLSDDAVLYVTLEPCSTQGKTPACTDFILEKKIRHVVVGCLDPNPAHAGAGIDLLRRAGVNVLVNVCQAAAEELIAPFAKRMIQGLPYITLKLGVTLDGRIADEDNVSQWITGADAREKVQALRRVVDAVMVGGGTVREDNPSLLPRPDRGRKPLRVVVGTNLPEESQVFTDEAAGRTVVIHGNLKSGMKMLAERDVMHVLCEGGGELAASLIRAELVDEFIIFMAPSLLGGTGVPMFGKAGWALDQMPRLDFKCVEKCGDDIYIRAVPLKEN
jgi:diaminohydroxyphosphoribosylaminopyrimidine deaminase / 5-amino-6-(5-phosphoribosylamino)uracil reductase